MTRAWRKKLRDEWHPDNDKPFGDFSDGSSYIGLWRCHRGHEWKAAINNRTRGTGCPYCAGRLVSKDNSLLALYPEIASEWHPDNTKSPDEVVPGSGYSALWRCQKGHQWRRQVAQRVGRKSRCPYCAGKKASSENNLLIHNPDLARRWHPSKNGKLRPEDVLPMSRKKVWWRRDDGSDWQAPVYKAAKAFQASAQPLKRSPRRTNPFTALHPNLLCQWHPDRNKGYSPDDFPSTSKFRPWWLCPDCDHEWQATISHRVAKSKCPACSKREREERYLARFNIAKTRPELVLEWHPTRNGDYHPSDFLPSASFVAWWRCQRGHEWKARIGGRKKGGRCPICARNKANKHNNLARRFPDIALEWHPTRNGVWKPEDFTWSSSKSLWWICSDCSHEWQATPNNRTRGRSCPACTPHGGFDPKKRGYLYLLFSEERSSWQIGITNNPARRLNEHLRHGAFRAKEVWEFADGKEARRAEKKILQFWEKKNIKPVYFTEEEMPQGGFTETAAVKDLPRFSLRRWTRQGKEFSERQVANLYKREALLAHSAQD